jgi:hypothetical protein
MMIVVLRANSMPELVPSSADPTLFSEERARVPLKYLTTNIGARPMCSLKNVEARDYLLSTLNELANQTKNLFVSSDDFGNVLSVLEGSNGPDNALLVSSHYDTVLLSPGAYDDTSGVVTILEVLRALVHSPQLPHTVLFLLNNGEEMGLLGSAYFVQNSPYASHVAGFVNMDSIPGTKPMLFEVTGSWMEQEFAKVVPRPLGNVAGSDTFQNGLTLGSKTDFLNYATLNVSGLDFAFFDRRQFYHSLQDNYERMENGSVQFLGDNILAAVKAFAASSELNKNNTDHGPRVFFDISEISMVVYSKSAGTLLNVIFLVLLAAFVILAGVAFRGDKLDFYTYDEDKSVILGFFRGFVMHVLSIIAGLGIALFVAFLISLWNPFFYNTSLNIALFTYGSATFVGYFLVRWLADRMNARLKLSDRAQETDAFFGVQVLWVVLLVIAAIVSNHFGMAYVLTFFGIFSFGGVLIQFVIAFFGRNFILVSVNTDRFLLALLIFMISTFLPVWLLMEFVYLFLKFAVQGLGDVVVAGLVSFLIVVSLLSVIPLTTYVRSYGKVLIVSLIVLVICVLVASFKAPYDIDHPQRLNVQHLYRPDTNTTHPSVLVVSALNHAKDLSAVLKDSFKYDGSSLECEAGVAMCYIYVPEPNATVAQYTVSNMTVEALNNDSKVCKFNLDMFSNGSLFHDLHFKEGTNADVFIQGGVALSPLNEKPLGYKNYGPNWTWNISLDLASVKGNDTTVKLSAHWNDIQYSSAIQHFVSVLPEWATFVGRGTGLVVVEQYVDIDITACRQ